MPNYSRHDVILVRYPFSDLTSAKVRPAVIVGWGRPGDLLIVPLTSRTGSVGKGEFVLSESAMAGLVVASAIKRGIYTAHENLVAKMVGRLSSSDSVRLDQALHEWLELA